MTPTEQDLERARQAILELHVDDFDQEANAAAIASLIAQVRAETLEEATELASTIVVDAPFLTSETPSYAEYKSACMHAQAVYREKLSREIRALKNKETK